MHYRCLTFECYSGIRASGWVCSNEGASLCMNRYWVIYMYVWSFSRKNGSWCSQLALFIVHVMMSCFRVHTPAILAGWWYWNGPPFTYHSAACVCRIAVWSMNVIALLCGECLLPTLSSIMPCAWMVRLFKSLTPIRDKQLHVQVWM